ncbi:MAG: hypothetical protein KGJ37_04440 [Verrucomicrobiota bacterium]|nr:hypothetical protein [Verrucomicrobiota bacterium]
MMVKSLQLLKFGLVLGIIATGSVVAMANTKQLLKDANACVDKAEMVERAISDAERANDGPAQVQLTLKSRVVTISIADAESLAGQLRTKAGSDCDKIDEQLKMDLKAVDRERASIEQGQKELEDWTKQAEDAQTDAVIAGLNLLLGGMVSDLEQWEKSTAAYKGWITRRFNAVLGSESYPELAAAIAKLDGAIQKFSEMHVGLVNTLRQLEKPAKGAAEGVLSAKELWDVSKATVAIVMDDLGEISADLRNLKQQPGFSKLASDERPDVDLQEALVAKAIEEIGPDYLAKKYAKLAGPAASIGSFVVDYGYNAAKWETGRERIMQQYDLANKNLKAVEALKEQLERTMNDAKACRARLGKAPISSPSS